MKDRVKKTKTKNVDLKKINRLWPIWQTLCMCNGYNLGSCWPCLILVVHKVLVSHGNFSFCCLCIYVFHPQLCFSANLLCNVVLETAAEKAFHGGERRDEGDTSLYKVPSILKKWHQNNVKWNKSGNFIILEGLFSPCNVFSFYCLWAVQETFLILLVRAGILHLIKNVIALAKNKYYLKPKEITLILFKEQKPIDYLSVKQISAFSFSRELVTLSMWLCILHWHVSLTSSVFT